jgi:hypothetical protein
MLQWQVVKRTSKAGEANGWEECSFSASSTNASRNSSVSNISVKKQAVGKISTPKNCSKYPKKSSR